MRSLLLQMQFLCANIPLNILKSYSEQSCITDTSKAISLICRLRNAHPNPDLKLNGTLIPVVEWTKFLGVIFDNKITFLPHIRYLKEKCMKALNLLRVVAHTSRGADQQTLVRRLWQCRVWFRARILLTYIGSNTEPCIAAMPRCLQNLTCL